MNGILALCKPSGPTSHDCVNRVRRALGTRRVGHAGTLDPMARGVLIIGVGSGTRILEYLQGLPKTYRATMRLGLETDTQDTTGRALAERDASGITRQQVLETLAAFRGDIFQVPPMVSALKVGGRKLYDLARRGETVERAPRPVTVYELDLLTFVPGVHPEAEIRVVCSAGTYIRTLCHDVGQQLGVGAAMSALEREAVGPFRSVEAVPLDEVEQAGAGALIPPARALSHLPSYTVDAGAARALAHGQFIPAPEAVPEGPIRILDDEGRLLAIATVRSHGEARLLAPEKVLAAADAANSGS